jgi:hypothetical protein
MFLSFEDANVMRVLLIAAASESENPDDSREENYGEFRQFVSIAACL